MQNEFLKGNGIIEQAMDKARANEFTEESINGLIAALQTRMREDGHLLLPVEPLDEDDNNRFLLRGVPDEDGEIYLACFTSEAELNKGEKTAVISQFIDVFLINAVDLEDVRGIVINPWSGGCRIPKTVLQVVLEVKKPAEKDWLRSNRLLEKAIRFATVHHAGQLRKGTTVPYILHPLETMQILRTMGADTNLLMAGVLHDTIEDTEATFNDIVEQFGTDVAELVSAHSEDKSKTWEERKTAAIAHLHHAGSRLKMLVMADKVANLRSMVSDYRICGEQLWQRFNAPKEQQAWYYSGIQDALREMQNDPRTAPVYWEMVELYKDLFVRYYLDTTDSENKGNRLLQVSASGEAYALHQGESVWQPVPEPCTAGLLPMTRQEAEKTEDSWH